MAGDTERRAQVLELIEEGTKVLARFIEREHYEPESAWESVVELEEITGRLRELCPPKPFFSRKDNASARAEGES